MGNLDNGKLINNFDNSIEWIRNHPIYSQGLVSKNGEMGSIIINLDDEINYYRSFELYP